MPKKKKQRQRTEREREQRRSYDRKRYWKKKFEKANELPEGTRGREQRLTEAQKKVASENTLQNELRQKSKSLGEIVPRKKGQIDKPFKIWERKEMNKFIEKNYKGKNVDRVYKKLNEIILSAKATEYEIGLRFDPKKGTITPFVYREDEEIEDLE